MFDRLRSKHLHNWIGAWLRQQAGLHLGPRPARGPRHLIFAFADHYEPLHGDVDPAHGRRRVEAWRTAYPELARHYLDADGRPPRHSFFFPGEQYAPEYLEPLGELAALGLGEVEVHLHHDGDSAAKLRADLLTFLRQLDSHGHLSRAADGVLRYAFIHGNWALANGRKDGRWCGVDEEIALLHDTGCYADLTFPSAPDECQPGIINQIYWPTGDLTQKRAYEHGERARVGSHRDDRLLMIEGPLALARRPGRLALRVESAALTAHDPASPERVKTWIEQDVHVAGRPEWLFVKVHTHGAPDAQAESLLGAGGHALHQALARYNDGVNWQLHYVTAREMFNIARAAMAGLGGSPGQYRDHILPPPPIARATSR
jgi:hypothetical protein